MKSKKEKKKAATKEPKPAAKKKIAAPKKSSTKIKPEKKTSKAAAKTKITKIVDKPKVEKNKLAKKTTIEKSDAKKKFFPKGAKPSAPPSGAVEPKVVSKRTPWMKKPIENPHSTPAGPCINLKDLFDNYLDKKYKKLKDEQRHALWKQVSFQMLSEPFSRLNEIIDSHLSKK